MSDITKCSNEKCLFKNDCFRYTVKPHENQSYQEFEVITDGYINLCDFFILNDNNTGHIVLKSLSQTTTNQP